MLAKDADTVLLKLKRGGNISVDVKDVSVKKVDEEKLLYEGEGIATVVPKKRKNSAATDSIRKIFEDKETAAELEAIAETVKPKKPEVRSWKNVNNDIKITSQEPACEMWKWNEFSIPNDVVIDNTQPLPITLKPVHVDLSESKPGVVQQPFISDDYTNLESTQIVAPFQPLTADVDPEIVKNLLNMADEDLEKTAKVEHVLSDKIEKLPTVSQISELSNIIKSGTLEVEEKDGLKVQGLKVLKGDDEYFIVGQNVDSSSGTEFIPGKTVETTSGSVFVPGMVVNTENGVKLLPGCVLDVNGQREFVAGQVTLTSKGEQFVAGQVLKSPSGTKFQPGQTVFTEEGIKFIPGQVVEDRFVPGQVIISGDGPQFVAGQVVDSERGTDFVPGQSYWSEDGWKFVPGMTVSGENGSSFVPGRRVVLNDGTAPTFVPGQYVVENGNEIFVPGVTIGEEQNGPQFVNGMSVPSPDGDFKFVQGKLVNIEGVQKFIPGSMKLVDGEPKFGAATSLEEVRYVENKSIDSLSQLSQISKITLERQQANSVFGHIVQSLHGVEFFPGTATCLPKGKVVPGRLIRGEEIKFVPGIMVEETFVPGQVVMTERGEQFIPGQVVETADGPKFVPGRIIVTMCGEKFLPGQTVETVEGPKFVPGQIIETRAGPTFIPGQVIHTDEGGAKFVPGQVVETREGPRFVPGRVMETGDQVTFIPGQIVETSEGLRFVAPDLIGEDDNAEFTVQGYEISSEELKLIQSKSPEANAIETREMTIDSKMMRQLSEAGIPIGYQVNTEVPSVNIRTAPAMNTACSLGNKLKLDPVTTIKLSEVIAGVVQAGKLGEVPGHTEEVQAINKILERVIHCKSDEEAYRLVSSIIEKEMSNNIIENVDRIHGYLTGIQSPLKRVNKVSAVKEILNCEIARSEVFKKMAVIMDEEDDTVSDALQHFSEVKPDIVDQIVQRFSDTVGKLESEKEVVDTLRCAIVASIRESSERAIVDLLKDTETLDLKTLILEAVALAKALDLQDAAKTLVGIASNPKCTNILAGDRITLEILRRLTVMRQLAERRPELLEALKNLNHDPYGARTDPGIKQLVRESAALLVVPEEGIKTSQQVPTALFFSQNSLAMEEFLYKTKSESKILVISKHGCEAVIPREAAHSVLAGKVPYVLLDEKGIHHFQPKHVFTAINLPKICTNWFSLYKCEFKEVVTN
uniref:Glutamyl-tRNA(Gln) amidotransferase subunit D n=1 Tax=Lygus hesperus TaxID=30085 RepID=A0A0A9YCB2_LYGHE